MNSSNEEWEKGGMIMRKMTLLGLVFAIVLILGGSVQAGRKAQPCNEDPCAIEGTYSSISGEFKATMWKEKSEAGEHGALGNELMAVGDSFIFRNAVLTDVTTSDGETFVTTYEGGELILNSSASWLNCGQLIATNITAINTSTRDVDGNLSFELTFGGTFDNCDCDFDVTVTFDASEDRYQEVRDEDGYLVFHKGRDFEVTIDIICPEP